MHGYLLNYSAKPQRGKLCTVRGTRPQRSQSVPSVSIPFNVSHTSLMFLLSVLVNCYGLSFFKFDYHLKQPIMHDICVKDQFIDHVPFFESFAPNILGGPNILCSNCYAPQRRKHIIIIIIIIFLL